MDYLRGKCRVIIVNDNYQLAPWADMHYACDLKWHKWHHNDLSEFEGAKFTMDREAASLYRLRYIEGRAGHGLSIDPSLIHTGGNSGFQALNVAYHMGASHVMLLGFDMKLSEKGASHWFGDHPDGIRSNYAPWLKAFEQAAKQDLIDIINCTRDTALTCFEQMTIQEAI